MTSVESLRAPFRIKGWHVLVGFIAFFGVIIALDAYFMVLAYSSFPGQSSANPYETGLRFNRELDMRAREAALGWGVRAELAPDGAILLTVQDRRGAPLKGLQVTASLVRPATESGRLSATFTEVAPGHYRAPAPAAKGGWDVMVHAANAQGQFIETQRRLIWH